MRTKLGCVGYASTLAMVVGLFLTGSNPAVGQTEDLLHSFAYNQKDGFHPVGSLVVDSAGNLYGTAGYGGFNANCYITGEGCGSVFELTPRTGGGWTETPLHNFGSGKDGANPWAGVVFDDAGNLFGTTVDGGANNLGTVFELSPVSGGGWTGKVIHSFGSGMDGFNPTGTLILDASGNIYGSTQYGGAYGAGGNGGVVFELVPRTGGGYGERILHSFGHGHDGFLPASGLIFDAAGNLYGTTYYGGFSSTNCNPDVHVSCGTVFELSPTTSGSWTETILHSFGNSGTDGNFPYGGLIFDASGNLYGTTTGGGNSSTCGSAVGCGIVFELSPSTGGVWTESILHNFNGDTTDGSSPDDSLIFDASGNLYGTAGGDGLHGGGVVFELSPAGGGIWNETLLHSFGLGHDGKYPNSGLVFDASGNLYGSTIEGGAYGNGTAFEITP